MQGHSVLDTESLFKIFFCLFYASFYVIIGHKAAVPFSIAPKSAKEVIEDEMMNLFFSVLTILVCERTFSE